MENSRMWQVLTISSPDVPVLLVSATFDGASYDIIITDLANVWQESLGRAEICDRGRKEKTAINPEYDDEQMGILLGKIRAAFDPSQKDHFDSYIALSFDRGGGVSRESSLVLRVTSILPEGLQPLVWPLYLKRRPPESIASELVLPLIQSYDGRLREVAQLRSVIHDKDAVIQKLLDKLEALGVGLEGVFPTRLGRTKLVDNSLIMEQVKGLAPFRDEHFWPLPVLHPPSLAERTAENLLQAVFGHGHFEEQQERKLVALTTDVSGLDGWWLKLGAEPKVCSVVEHKKTDKAETKRPSLAHCPGTEDEDTFESLPKQNLPEPAKPTTAIRDSGSRLDGSESAANPVLDNGSLPRTAAAKTTGKRLGAIGSKKSLKTTPTDKNTPKDSTTGPTHTTAASLPGNNSILRDAGQGELSVSALRHDQPQEPPSNPGTPLPMSPPAKKVLGKIGKASSPAIRAVETQHLPQKTASGSADVAASAEARTADIQKNTESQAEANTRASSPPAKVIHLAIVTSAAPKRKKRKF